MSIREQAGKLITRIDDLTLRERAIVFAGLMTALFLGWYAYLMEPLAKEQKTLVTELDSRRQQFQELNDQFALMVQNQGQGPDEAGRKRLAELRAEEARLKVELSSATTQLVKSEAMPDLLRQVLSKSAGLELVKLSGLGSTALVPKATPAKGGTVPEKPAAGAKGTAESDKPADAAKAPEGELASAYKHGMEIQFTGDFFATLNYMRRLEQLEWGFFWDSVDFAVAEYPQSVASIRVFTLSLNPNWIGT